MMVLPLLAAIAAFWPSFVALHAMWVDWEDTTHTHGYLIVAICLVLLWRSWRSCQCDPQQPGPAPKWPLLVAGIIWLFVVQAGLQTVEFAVLPLLLWCAFMACFGRRVALHVIFPFLYFYFAMPLWGAANGVLQKASIMAVHAALRASGVPVLLESNFVQIPAGTFEIQDGCSGLHFFVVALAIAALLGELRGDNWRRRLLLIVLAAAVAIITNWIRIYTIVLAGHMSHMQHYLVSRSHYWYGWVLFAVAMAVFLYWEGKSSRDPQVSERGLQAWSVSVLRIRGSSMAVALGLLAVLAGWQALAARPAEAGFVQQDDLAGWRAEEAATDWQPRFVGVDAESLRRYRRGEDEVTVYHGLYRTQRQGKELGGYHNDPLGGAVPDGATSLLLNDSRYMVYRIGVTEGKQRVVAITYDVAGRSFSSAAPAQLWFALKSLLTLRSPASRIVMLSTQCRADCADALVLLESAGA